MRTVGLSGLLAVTLLLASMRGLAQDDPVAGPPPAEAPPLPGPELPAAETAVLADTASPPAPELRLDQLLAPRISPTRAVLGTAIFPGWGQLYSRNSWRAGLAFGVEMFYWSHLLMKDRQARRTRDFAERLAAGPRRDTYEALAEEYFEQMRDFAWWSAGALLVIAVDAYVGAHLFRFDEDTVPVPDRWEDGVIGDGSGPVADMPGPRVVVFRWRIAF